MDRLKFSTVLAVAAFALLMTTWPSSASADARSSCQRRVEKAQDHYRHEAHEHGKHSPQAEHARARLTAEWDRCWNEAHTWYDPHRHEWRTDRDWDRNYDWDRERDDRDRNDR